MEMYFRNDSTKAPWPLALLGCSQRCPLPDFLRLTLALVPEDWEQECQGTSSVTDTGEPWTILLSSHTEGLLSP